MPKQPPPQLNPQQTTQILILGGGFGGLYTALKLQKFKLIKQKNYQITLIDQHDHILFTPLLYELITNELEDWEIAPKFNQLLQNTPIQFIQAKIINLDLAKKQVTLEQQETLTYDYLVLAVGRKSRLEGIPGLHDYALSFRTLEDTHKLKQSLENLENSPLELIRVSIIGGGPSGVELAVKIADRLGNRGEVDLITRGNRILRHFTAATRNSAINALDRRKVRVILETEVEKIEPNSLTLKQLHESFTLPTNLVIWTTGTDVRDWVKTLDCFHNEFKQVIVESSLQLSDYPEVFALGDVAEILDEDGKQVPPMAQAAYQEANFLAQNMVRFFTRKRLKKFRYLHLGEMMTLGLEDSAITSFGFHLHGKLAHLIRCLVYLERMPTFNHKIKVLSNWFKKWFKIGST
jgi:demethylphylloquinone reductase